MTTTTEGIEMELVEDQAVTMKAFAIAEAEAFGKPDVPKDGRVTVVSPPNEDGALLVKWPSATFWINMDWLEGVADGHAHETVTLTLDARTMNGLSDIFFDWYTIDVDAAIEKVRSMGVQK